MEENLEKRIRILELEVEKLKQEKVIHSKQTNSWIWAFVPILALLIPVLAIIRDMF